MVIEIVEKAIACRFRDRERREKLDGKQREATWDTGTNEAKAVFVFWPSLSAETRFLLFCFYLFCEIVSSFLLLFHLFYFILFIFPLPWFVSTHAAHVSTEGHASGLKGRERLCVSRLC